MNRMIRTALVLALATLMTGGAWAQDDAKPTTDAQKRFAQLEADLQEDMSKAQAAERKKMEVWKAAAAKAKEAGEDVPPMPAMAMGPPKELVAKYLGLYQKAAADYAGTDDAIDFVAMAIQIASVSDDKDTLARLCKTLTTDHIKSEKLGDSLDGLSYVDAKLGKGASEKLLRQVEAGSPHANVKARAILVRVSGPLAGADVDSPTYAAARKDALHAAKIATDPAIKREVKAAIDGREKLVSGNVAPDISGVDLDGVKFKLSDYKGKVVMLDFWGNW